MFQSLVSGMTPYSTLYRESKQPQDYTDISIWGRVFPIFTPNVFTNTGLCHNLHL